MLDAECCPGKWQLCRFAVPKGVLGQLYSNPLDLPKPQGEQPFDTDMWTQWALPDQNIFSTGEQLYGGRSQHAKNVPSQLLLWLSIGRLQV